MEYKFGDDLMTVRITIENGYTNLLSTVNSGVNLLFWEIGTLLNNNLGKHDHLLNDIPSRLSPVFGDYLDSESLSLMRLFAERCSISTIGQISDVINWKYIHYLLELNTENEWLFYTKLIQVDLLTPIKLQNQILKKTIDNRNIDNAIFLDRTKMKSLFRDSCLLYFGANDSKRFNKLFEPRESQDKEIAIFLSKQSDDETIMNIYRMILEFQSETHYVLNMQFNMLMWTIGGAIIRLSVRLKVSVADCITKCIQEFGSYFPSVFNKEELPYCIKLAEQYKSSNAIMEISELVSWSHIKVLLEINDLAKQNFVAKKVLNEGIDVEQLKQLFSKNLIDFKGAANTSNLSIRGNSTTTETRAGNNITSITEHLITPISHPLHDLNRNIYKTPEILAFLTNNTF